MTNSQFTQGLILGKVLVLKSLGLHKVKPAPMRTQPSERSLPGEQYFIIKSLIYPVQQRDKIKSSNLDDDILCSPAIQTHFSYCVFLCLAELDQSGAGGGKY